MRRWSLLIGLLIAGVVLMSFSDMAYALPHPSLFGYNESEQTASEIIGQFRNVLDNQDDSGVSRENCSDPDSQGCQLYKWKAFIDGLRGKPPVEQVTAINSYANHKRYRTDKDNYGTGDHWATPAEFLSRGGDCEDFALFKFLSLRYLGFNPDSIRIVVLVDTNLRAPHAVLTVDMNNDVLVLDNQTNEIISHRKLSQYVPVYSVNETGWWIHTPK
jgi:predicted transglutaminase-like cysteine proteinase